MRLLKEKESTKGTSKEMQVTSRYLDVQGAR